MPQTPLNLDQEIERLTERKGKLELLAKLQAEVTDLELRCFMDQSAVAAMARQIATRVCLEYGISMERLASKRRDQCSVLPRHIVIYLLRKYSKATTVQVGRMFRVNHTTVINSEKDIRNRLCTCADFKNLLSEIEGKLEPARWQEAR